MSEPNPTYGKKGKKKEEKLPYQEWRKRFDKAYDKIRFLFSLKEIEEMIEERNKRK